MSAGAASVQDPDLQYCDRCKRRMSLIPRLPGGILSAKAVSQLT
jgi:hypothetical protein